MANATDAKNETAAAVRLLSRATGFECDDSIDAVRRCRAGDRLSATEAAQAPLDAAVADWFDAVASAQATAEAMAIEADPSVADDDEALRRRTRDPLDP